jgi:predicted nuclease of restriction endonuclease-like RecB superfamily
MLTSDLVRTETRGNRVEPLYLDPDSSKAHRKAEALTSIFESHRDEPRGAIEDRVDAVVGHGTDYKIWRGLAKLLYDRSEFETVAAAEPEEIRREAFERAADGDIEADGWRREVVDHVADSLEIEPDEVEAGLYADLDERQRLVEYDPIDPQDLLHRYNLALAQAVLYKATKLEIELGETNPNMLRYLFQALKFNRLMHRVRREEGGYRLVVDGPASLFERNRKYGMHMATFLPALVLADDWRLRAELDWEDQRCEFRLSDEKGLVSHYEAQGQWKADEEKRFEEKFESTETDWEFERRGTILELDDNVVIVPDYVLSHPDGREVYLEIVGFWRLSYLERRIDLLVREQEIPLILAVSDRLHAGREDLEDSPAEVFFFKTVILVDKVLEAAERASDGE